MKNPSRKFIDLIRNASSKWANWDPPNQIKVGDYGSIDEETGQFEKEGNIYEDAEMAKLTSKHGPEFAAADNVLILSSSKVKRHDLSVTPQISVAGVADASIKGQWEFGAKRGALLIMDQPRSSRIPPDKLLKDLVNLPALKDMSLVTEVISCPAYSLYLSSGESDVIDVALVGSGPTGAPAVTAGGGVGVKWWTQNITGTYRDGCDPNGLHSYTPLYVLKQRRKTVKERLLRRESPVAEPEGDDLWVDAQEPWDPLNEDGEVEAFEDTVFDDPSDED